MATWNLFVEHNTETLMPTKTKNVNLGDRQFDLLNPVKNDGDSTNKKYIKHSKI